MGGDEFVVLVDFEEPLAMEDLVRRIEAALDALNASRRRSYQISLSIGRSMYAKDSGKAAGFLARLDSDMYARKREKKAAEWGKVPGPGSTLPA
jgi:GGDEF domain-containing protein